MATVSKLVPIIFKWEGGFVNDPIDLGGPTNMGVTLNTWQGVGYDKNEDNQIDINDLWRLTQNDVINHVLKPHYWDRWKADQIVNQSIANILVDWLWCSGFSAIKRPQKLLGVKIDGIVGPQTLHALNNHENPSALFSQIKKDRELYLDQICASRPANNRFKKGWLRRLNEFEFA